MKIRFIFISLFLISINSPISSAEIDCNEFSKLSAKYLECTAKKIKEKTSGEINKGKKKLDKSELGKKFDKFKKSKTLSDLINN